MTDFQEPDHMALAKDHKLEAEEAAQIAAAPIVKKIEELNSDLRLAVSTGQDLLRLLRQDDEYEMYNRKQRLRLLSNASITLNALMDKYCFGGKPF